MPIYAKEKNAADLRMEQFVGYRDRIGDSWTYTAVERNTKLVVAWHFGTRQQHDTDIFCDKLAKATTGRFHLSTDGLQNYRYAVPTALGVRQERRAGQSFDCRPNSAGDAAILFIRAIAGKAKSDPHDHTPPVRHTRRPARYESFEH